MRTELRKLEKLKLEYDKLVASYIKRVELLASEFESRVNDLHDEREEIIAEDLPSEDDVSEKENSEIEKIIESTDFDYIPEGDGLGVLFDAN